MANSLDSGPIKRRTLARIPNCLQKLSADDKTRHKQETTTQRPRWFDPGGGGGGGVTLNFSSYVGSGPVSTLHPKKYHEFQAKYLKILATQNDIHILYNDMKKRP